MVNVRGLDIISQRSRIGAWLELVSLVWFRYDASGCASKGGVGGAPDGMEDGGYRGWYIALI
jgi:hypothetical protein